MGVSSGIEAIEGEWGNFLFKMVQPEDHERVLKHLRESLYYRAFFRLGFTKDMDDEMEVVFRAVLNDGHNLCFFAEDKASGKIAGCRIITMEIKSKVDDGTCPFNSRICKGIMKLYDGLKDECNVFERYNCTEYPHMFGISVDEEFCQLGLATEIYRRAKELVKERGHKVAMVGFISPYSRAGAAHHGFIQLAKKQLLQATDEEGNVLHPEANPEDFMDLGVFEIN